MNELYCFFVRITSQSRIYIYQYILHILPSPLSLFFYLSFSFCPGSTFTFRHVSLRYVIFLRFSCNIEVYLSVILLTHILLGTANFS